MPAYRPLEQIVNSKQVRSLLSRARTWRQIDPDFPVELHSAPAVDGPLPDHIIAFDSSWQETAAGALQKDVYPSAQVGYMTLSTVLLKAAELARLSEERPMDPVQYKRTRDEMTTPVALPGANLVTDDNVSAKTSFRHELYDMLATAQEGAQRTDAVEVGSLLKAYEQLLADYHEGRTRCPYSSTELDLQEQDFCQYQAHTGREKRYRISEGETVCPCPREMPIWSTDAMRIHERFLDDGPNGNQFGTVAQVMERLELLRFLHLIRSDEFLLANAHRIAFVSDGQLAVFGGPAWMARALEMEIRCVNAEVRKRTGHDMVIVAVEKTGQFVDHFELIDRTADPGIRRFQPRQFFIPTNDYITSRIANNETGRMYGSQTHFGRKLFYKTANEYRLVVTTAFLRREQHDLDRSEAAALPFIGKNVGSSGQCHFVSGSEFVDAN